MSPKENIFYGAAFIGAGIWTINEGLVIAAVTAPVPGLDVIGVVGAVVAVGIGVFATMQGATMVGQGVSGEIQCGWQC